MTKKDEDGEALLERHPMAGLQPPKAVEPLLPIIEVADIDKVIARIRKGHTVEDLRDEAIIRFLFATGCRRGEVESMRTDPNWLNLREGTAMVTGKTGPRVVQFDPKTAAAIHKYARMRRSMRYAVLSNLWLSHRGPLKGNGIFQAVQQRFTEAGVAVEHAVHAFRHTFAHTWQLRGGNSTALGWPGPHAAERNREASESSPLPRASYHGQVVTGVAR